MPRESFRTRAPRSRTITKRDPLSQAAFNLRRLVSRISLADTGALLLVWGNIVGLLAYPVIANSHFLGKTAQKSAVVKDTADKG